MICVKQFREYSARSIQVILNGTTVTRVIIWGVSCGGRRSSRSVNAQLKIMLPHHPSARTAKQKRRVSKSLRLTSIRTPNVFGEAIRRLVPVASIGNACTFGTLSNAGQKGICTVVVIVSGGNSVQKVPSRRSNPSAVLERIICCCTVSSLGSADGDFGFFTVHRRDAHSTVTSNTRKMVINPTLANGGRHTVPMTAKKQANQKQRRQTAAAQSPALICPLALVCRLLYAIFIATTIRFPLFARVSSAPNQVYYQAARCSSTYRAD